MKQGYYVITMILAVASGISADQRYYGAAWGFAAIMLVVMVDQLCAAMRRSL
jgi:hypothetical protein